MRPEEINLDNAPGSAELALAEFDMFKNINLLVVEHCNLSCRHCGTGSPFANKITHPVESFFEGLDILVGKNVDFKYISLTGGEPFLHPGVRNGNFIRQLRLRYPTKRIGLTTNFFWASEDRIRQYAPIIRMMNGGVMISVYEPIIRKVGGRERYDALVQMLMESCPNTAIVVQDRPEFLKWEFHRDARTVGGGCATADCFTMKPDGILTHCSLMIAGQNIAEYRPIVASSKDGFLDLKQFDQNGTADAFAAWSRKYPFDLCSYCDMWEGKTEPWSSER